MSRTIKRKNGNSRSLAAGKSKKSWYRSERNHLNWSRLLHEAVSKPGLLLAAYQAFPRYSLGNRLAVAYQCSERGLSLTPIDTYQGWLSRIRQVRKGEKALWLCVPVLGHRAGIERRAQRTELSEAPQVSKDSGEETTAATGETQTAGESQKTKPQETGLLSTALSFVWRPGWFVLSQTDAVIPTDNALIAESGASKIGKPAGSKPEGEVGPLTPTAATTPFWDRERALERLQVTMIPFEHPDGNIQGYATKAGIEVSPLASLPHKTLFHELAHVVLGHTEASLPGDGEVPSSQDIKEIEAETTAYLVCATLGLPGTEYCRGYIQSWLKDLAPAQGHIVLERQARRIFAAADKILAAGVTGGGKDKLTPSPTL